jgi:hypothetical protein
VDEVPVEVRDAVTDQIARLVAGDLPGLMTWVQEYGESGATLVPPPDDWWAHPWSDALPGQSGGWHVVVPLWTTDESPSGLSAEVEVTDSGQARITDVHVL